MNITHSGIGWGGGGGIFNNKDIFQRMGGVMLEKDGEYFKVQGITIFNEGGEVKYSKEAGGANIFRNGWDEMLTIFSRVGGG